MKGYYFHNMDIRSTRAHACQILNTAASINNAEDSKISLCIVLPKYGDEVDSEVVRRNHDLLKMPKFILLNNFWIRKSGLAAFVLFNVPAIWFLFRKKIKKEIDFLYFRSSYFLPLAIMARVFHIPFFYETHRRPISWNERQRDHIMSMMATGFIVISDHMKEHYLRYGKKILVAHDAVSLNRFASKIDRQSARKMLGVLPTEKICVYAGTISRLKGIQHVIGTARILPKVHFVLVGIVSPEFIGAVLPFNVKILGKIDQKELPNILQAADILLLPHPISEYSQSPMKLFEYMASRVPIVASRLPSISEILNDKNSILVEPENENAIAHGIEVLLKDASFAEMMSKQAYDDVQNYTWDKRGVAIVNFVKDILGSRFKNYQ